MSTMRAVVEVFPFDAFALWPAARWTEDHLPAHAPRVNAALARLLDV